MVVAAMEASAVAEEVSVVVAMEGSAVAGASEAGAEEVSAAAGASEVEAEEEASVVEEALAEVGGLAAGAAFPTASVEAVSVAVADSAGDINDE